MGRPVRCPHPNFRAGAPPNGNRGSVIALSADGRTAAATGQWHLRGMGSYGTLPFWDSASGKVARTLENPGGGIISMALSPNGRHLAAGIGFGEGFVRVWDGTAPPQRLSTGSRPGVWRGLSVSANGRVAAADESHVWVWDLPGPASSPRRLWQAARVAPHHVGYFDPVTFPGMGPVALSPDGRRLACIGDGDHVQLRDGRTGRLLHLLASHPGGTGYVAYLPDGKRVASISGGAARIWDARSGGLRRTLGMASAVTLAPDGRTAAVAGLDGVVRLWNLGKAAPSHALPGHFDRIRSLAFTPDGRTLGATWLRGRWVLQPPGHLTLWDVATGQTRQLPAPDFAFSLVFARDRSEVGVDGKLSNTDGDGVQFLDTRAGNVRRTILGFFGSLEA